MDEDGPGHSEGGLTGWQQLLFWPCFKSLFRYEDTRSYCDPRRIENYHKTRNCSILFAIVLLIQWLWRQYIHASGDGWTRPLTLITLQVCMEKTIYDTCTYLSKFPWFRQYDH